MATVITSTLKASGGDFSSIKDWIAYLLANTPDFVVNDIIPTLECYNDWPNGLDETFVDFKSGFTTDADHKFRIVAADGEGHTGVAGTGFWFNSTTTNFVLYSRNNYVEFDGLELSAPNSSQVMIGDSGNTGVKNCILHDINSTGFSSTSGAEFENCIMYLTAPSSSGAVGKAAQNAKLTNVTAYISELSGGFNGDIVFHTCDCANVYMYHNRAKTSYDSFYNCTGDYNVALAINGDIPGANSFFITDDSDLEDPDNFDFRLKSTSPLMTAGENGGPIGAVFASEPVGGVVSDVDVNISQPLFDVNASAALPTLSGDVDFALSALQFNATANVELPKPVSDVSAIILSPLFSVDSNVELPQPTSNISASINAPTFNVNASTGLPQPVSNVSIELSSPLFSVEASTDLPVPQSIASFDISQPVFSISATSEALTVTLDVDIDINAPLFSVNAETTTPVFSDTSFNIESPSFSVESSVTIPDAVANVDIDISRPSFNVTMQISGVNIVIPKTGSSITYNPGLNSLVYYVGRNSLTYQPKSNSIKY